MLLRRFTTPEGKLYFFNKDRPNGVLETSPANLFVEHHLYTYHHVDGRKSTELESAYSQLEGKADTIVEKICGSARTGKLPCLTSDERATWDLFTYQQFKRVPDVLRKIVGKDDYLQWLAASVAEFERTERPLTEEERINLADPAVLERWYKNAMVESLGQIGDEPMEILASRGIAVAVIERQDKSFLVGSYPVAKLTNRSFTHLSHPSTELWLPIASDVAVTPYGPQRKELLVRFSDAKPIRNLNEAIWRQSTIIAGRSRELITSLVARYACH